MRDDALASLQGEIMTIRVHIDEVNRSVITEREAIKVLENKRRWLDAFVKALAKDPFSLEASRVTKTSDINTFMTDNIRLIGVQSLITTNPCNMLGCKGRAVHGRDVCADHLMEDLRTKANKRQRY